MLDSMTLGDKSEITWHPSKSFRRTINLKTANNRAIVHTHTQKLDHIE